MDQPLSYEYAAKPSDPALTQKQTPLGLGIPLPFLG